MNRSLRLPLVCLTFLGLSIITCEHAYAQNLQNSDLKLPTIGQVSSLPCHCDGGSLPNIPELEEQPQLEERSPSTQTSSTHPENPVNESSPSPVNESSSSDVQNALNVINDMLNIL